MILLAEDGRFVGIVFKFEQVVRWVFQKERAVFDAGPRKANPRLLVERESLRLRPICQRLPFLLQQKNQPEMTGVDSFLFRGLIRHDVRDKLMTGQTERDGLFRPPPDGTAEAIDVEPDGRLDIVNRKSEVKHTFAHRNRSFTVGCALPSHHPAAM